MKTRFAALALLAALQPHGVRAQSAPAVPDYARAERFLTWNTAKLVYGDVVAPRWFGAGDRFWYRVTTQRGAEFMLVETGGGTAPATRRPFFDNARLAAAITLAGDTTISPNRLPFREFTLGDEGRDAGAIEFDLRGRRYRCDVAAYRCTTGDTLSSRVPYARSPDGRWEAFVRAHNVWIRRTDRSDSAQLTTDGAELFAYGSAAPRPGQLIRRTPVRPILQWSPDSRKIAVARIDERRVQTIPLYSSTSQRPKAYTYPYALPGDSVIPVFDTFILDIESRRAVRVDAPPQTAQANGITGMRDSTWITVKWAKDAATLYLTHADRGPRRLVLLAADAATGATRVVAGDSSRTYVELNLDGAGTPNWRILSSGDVIWFSERDGWAHLYRYAADGRLRNRITEGPWTVGDIVHIDETAGRIWFTARGREPGRHPAFAHLYRASLDGAGLQLLTPEDGDHTIRFAPDGRTFVDTWSRVDVPPATVLRAADGRVLRELEKADIAELVAMGWKPGEPFTVKARDGITEIRGVMWKPTNFDPAKTYPVLDHIYPGPQIAPSPTKFFPTNDDALVYATMGQVQALAELGFIVVSVDHMGVNLRAKSFHDAWYANMGDNGIPDHIAAIQQLGARHPFMDLDRVGIYGHSGGGFASTGALLRHPDFFKLAVSTSGNHDNRTYYYGWAERYQGLLVRDTLRSTDNYANQSNPALAGNLKGKLFLIHGDMDDNVHPAMSLQVADALIKANKSFDLLIMTDLDHGVTQHPYVIRRSWDFFVRHFLGTEPPADYRITPPPPGG
jgi:dipeptidyl aminopeptidase/acylaminoacyl peptidase